MQKRVNRKIKMKKKISEAKNFARNVCFSFKLPRKFIDSSFRPKDNFLQNILLLLRILRAIDWIFFREFSIPKFVSIVERMMVMTVFVSNELVCNVTLFIEFFRRFGSVFHGYFFGRTIFVIRTWKQIRSAFIDFIIKETFNLFR